MPMTNSGRLESYCRSTKPGNVFGFIVFSMKCSLGWANHYWSHTSHEIHQSPKLIVCKMVFLILHFSTESFHLYSGAQEHRNARHKQRIRDNAGYWNQTHNLLVWNQVPLANMIYISQHRVFTYIALISAVLLNTGTQGMSRK